MTRGRNRSGSLRRSVTAALLLAAGCSIEPAAIDPNAYPAAGLYTPGSTIGASPMAPTGLGNRCKPLPLPDPGTVATKGTLTIEWKSQTKMIPPYAPKNCTAVWIETLDGAYVATPEIWAGLRRQSLVYFQERACTEKLGAAVDVISKATLQNHDMTHEATWKGLDLDEKLVPDGEYRLFIEVTETDKDPGEFEMFTFKKGPNPYPLTAQQVGEGFIADLKLAWMPMGTEIIGGAAATAGSGASAGQGGASAGQGGASAGQGGAAGGAGATGGAGARGGASGAGGARAGAGGAAGGF